MELLCLSFFWIYLLRGRVDTLGWALDATADAYVWLHPTMQDLDSELQDVLAFGYRRQSCCTSNVLEPCNAILVVRASDCQATKCLRPTSLSPPPGFPLSSDVFGGSPPPVACLLDQASTPYLTIRDPTLLPQFWMPLPLSLRSTRWSSEELCPEPHQLSCCEGVLLLGRPRRFPSAPHCLVSAVSLSPRSPMTLRLLGFSLQDWVVSGGSPPRSVVSLQYFVGRIFSPFLCLYLLCTHGCNQAAALPALWPCQLEPTPGPMCTCCQPFQSPSPHTLGCPITGLCAQVPLGLDAPTLCGLGRRPWLSWGPMADSTDPPGPPHKRIKTSRDYARELSPSTRQTDAAVAEGPS